VAGNPAFQGTPKAWVGFQSGNILVASGYSLSSPIFAKPGISGFNYHFSTAAYSVGSPSFSTPTLTVIPAGNLKQFTANPYSLGALVYTLPTIRRTVPLSPKPLTVGSPIFSFPAVKITFRFSANAWAVGSPVFATVRLQFNYKLTKPLNYSLGPLVWSPVGPFKIQSVIIVNEYDLSLRFAAPRLQTQIVVLDLPPTYLSQIEEATDVLVGMLNTLLSSIPPTPTKARDDLRIMVSTLRSNASDAIRGNTLGTQLQAVFLQADLAGATFPGVEATRQFLMNHAGSLSLYTQIVFRAALVMTMGLECKILSRVKFKTRDDVQQIILQLRAAFEEARDIGIEDVDALVYQTLTSLSGAIINNLSLSSLQLPRFVTWQSKAPSPSLYLANRIYADASRSDEIETENDVVNPAFCPVNLRVLSYPPT
jgi:hypothetical protein